MSVELTPITDEDVRRVAAFLQESMDTPASEADWARLMDVPWKFERPNHGFMLLDGDEVVGAYLAFYSDRSLNGRSERFCDLGTWCVDPDYRLHSVRLLQALLSQPGYQFTDLTPDERVIAVNERLGFRWLNGRTALVPNMPWPSWPGRTEVISDPDEIERALNEKDLEIFRDHLNGGSVGQVVLRRGDQTCHVVFRRDHRLRLPRALLLHVSDPVLYRKLSRVLGRHLLFRHGVVIQQVERGIVEHPPRLSIRVRSPHRMMRHAGGSIGPIDYLYSELARLSWSFAYADPALLFW